MKPLLGLALFLGLFLLAACDAKTSQTELPVTSDPDAFLAQLDQALIREGEVFHASAQATAAEPGLPDEPWYAYELWIDGVNGRARFEFQPLREADGGTPIRSVELAIGTDVYVRAGDDRAAKQPQRTPCLDRNLSPGVAWLLCMRGLPDGVTASVNLGIDFRGKPADALTLSKALVPADPDPAPRTRDAGEPDPGKPLDFAFRFFVDSDTSLPLGGEFDYRQDGKSFGTMRVQISSEFVPASSLAPGFFDPGAIGYVSPEDRERALLNSWLADGPFFWLGRHFDSASGFPSLDFAEVTDTRLTGPERDSVGFISYRGAPGRVVYVETWPSAGWASFWDRLRGGTSWGSNCAKRITLDLPGGTATIWLGYRKDALPPAAAAPSGYATPARTTGEPPVEPPQPPALPSPTPRTCTGEPFDVAIGWIETPGRVVTVNAPLGLMSIAGEKSTPFDTLAGIEALLRGIRPMLAGQ